MLKKARTDGDEIWGSAAGGTYRDAAISGTRDTSNAASHGKITEDGDAVRQTESPENP